MAKNNNLQDFLADIADAIRAAEGSSGTIAAQDFADRIRALDGVSEDLGTKLNIADFTLQTDASRIGPPYDADGYNYDGPAPTAYTQTVTKNLGDLTDYDQLALVWDNQGTNNNFGEVYAEITIDGVTTRIFSGSNTYIGNVVSKIDITGITGQQTATFKVYARSDSAYRYWYSQTYLNVKGIYVATYDLPDVEIGS